MTVCECRTLHRLVESTVSDGTLDNHGTTHRRMLTINLSKVHVLLDGTCWQVISVEPRLSGMFGVLVLRRCSPLAMTRSDPRDLIRIASGPRARHRCWLSIISWGIGFHHLFSRLHARWATLSHPRVPKIAFLVSIQRWTRAESAIGVSKVAHLLSSRLLGSML